MPRLPLVLAALTLFAGCRSGDAGPLRVDMGRRDPEPLLRFYLGAYLGPGGGDPFAAGIVAKDGDAFTVDPAALAAHLPDGAPALDADADGTLTGEELTAFAQATYGTARAFPATLDALRAETRYSEGFRLDTRGVMSVARRHVYVPEANLRSALARYRANGERIVYPAGTVFVGEHHLADAGAPDETTVMRKRADGQWDFFVYGANGRLADATHTAPRPLRSPTQCVGCHFGPRAFEPEKSFPAPAPPGPDGERAVYTDFRDEATTRFFDEHRKRSDRTLGLYATVYTARLRAARAAGTITPEDAALLGSLGMTE